MDSGQITADEARVHPSRSIITRALGSDPEMYADHFSLEVANGDRIIVCSDGLSSMISDADIESVAVSAASAQQAADNLVASALTAGGSDNVTVIVVDVLNDGVAAANHANLRKRAAIIGGVLAALVAVVADPANRVKMEFLSYHLLPDAAVLDPRMTETLPPRITAATGFDALVHAIEAATCLQRNPVSDAFAEKAMAQIVRALPRAVQNGKDRKHRCLFFHVVFIFKMSVFPVYGVTRNQSTSIHPRLTAGSACGSTHTKPTFAPIHLP